MSESRLAPADRYGGCSYTGTAEGLKKLVSTARPMDPFAHIRQREVPKNPAGPGLVTEPIRGIHSKAI